MKLRVQVQWSEGRKLYVGQIRRQKKSTFTETALNAQPQWLSDTKFLKKFGTLRSTHCIVAGESFLWVVCMCIHYQNLKFMLDCGNILSLISMSAISLTSYKDCVKIMMCLNSTPTCHLMAQKSPSNECCSDVSALTEFHECRKTIWYKN